MQIGLVGLGKMGYNLALNLAGDGYRVIGYDPGREDADDGIELVNSLPELVKSLEPRRVIWIMVPAGETVDHLINELALLVSPQDIIVDGGNSNYSVQEDSFAGKVVAALRNEFGGHGVVSSKKAD